MAVARDRLNLRERINEFLAKDLTFKVKFPFSPRSARKTKHKEEHAAMSAQILPPLKPPSPATGSLVAEIYANLFTKDATLNIELISTNLALCPDTEDLLQVEDIDHYNLFHKAIIFGCANLVQLLLDHGCNVNGLKSVEGCTNSLKQCSHERLGALHLACFLGRYEIVQLLLEHGADTSLHMRVYTSAVINDPAKFQPGIFRSMQLSKATEIMSKCGCRAPAFYAVLGDQLDIVKVLLANRDCLNQGPQREYKYLVHLSCRVGAYQCLAYLLDVFPREMNTKDTDGLPLLLMALNNGMRFVKLLLDRGCDIHVLDDFWERGTNILHLLFQGVPTQGTAALVGISQVTELCLQKGISVNAKRQPFNRTPLHDLLSVINSPSDINFQYNHGVSDYVSEHAQVDEELIQCVHLLLDHGANVTLKDTNDKSALQILLSNGNHTLRCNMCFDQRSSAPLQDAMHVRAFGLDNTMEIARLLLRARSNAITEHGHNTALQDLIEMICSSYFGWDFWAWTHSLEILEEDAIFESYVSLTDMLLKAGTDPNQGTNTRLPTLLYLLSHVADSPHVKGYIINVEVAHRLTKLLRLLLQYGAKTQVEVDMPPHGTRMIGCFDMFTPVLQTLRDNQRNSSDLEVLYVLALPVIQYGALSTVFHKLLYFIPDNFAKPWASPTPTHSFLFQYLLFGLFNLHYVNDGFCYRQLFEVFYCQVDHYTLQDVISMVSEQFMSMHGATNCACGACDNFRCLLSDANDKPRSLKQLCRLVIYDALKGKVAPNISHLPLPLALKDYIMSFDM